MFQLVNASVKAWIDGTKRITTKKSTGIARNPHAQIACLVESESPSRQRVMLLVRYRAWIQCSLSILRAAASRPPQDEVVLLEQERLMLRSARSTRLEAWVTRPLSRDRTGRAAPAPPAPLAPRTRRPAGSAGVCGRSR